MWRGGVGGTYLLPALSSAGASRAPPCSTNVIRGVSCGRLRCLRTAGGQSSERNCN